MTAYAAEAIDSSMVTYEGVRHGRGRIAEFIGHPVGVFFVYRMRGHDTTLASLVYWTSDHSDATAADYTGPGPVTNIIVQHVGRR